MGLSVYVVAVERDLLSRPEAADRTLTLLKFLHASHQGPEPDATGYKGFYYHFLDMETGRRAWQCELSTIDTAILMAGVLTAASYFVGNNDQEREIRELADSSTGEWTGKWALNRRARSPMGGSPSRDSFHTDGICVTAKRTSCTCWPWDRRRFPLIPRATGNGRPPSNGKPSTTSNTCMPDRCSFIRCPMSGWISAAYATTSTESGGSTTSRTAGGPPTCNGSMASRILCGFSHYHQYGWGFTASDGPGDADIEVNGVRRSIFSDYVARGAPFGPDDGTISPWAVVTSLPFAPEIVIDTIRHAIERLDLKSRSPYGFDASFNPTYPERSGNPYGWVSPWIFGLNQGPIILMIENFQSQLIWKYAQVPSPRRGLRRGGFRDGWLDKGADAAGGAEK